MIVTLSDGTVVTFKDYYTHKAENILNDELERDVVLEPDEEGYLRKKRVPAANVRRAYEAVLPYLIESPQVTQPWLEGLRREDYGLLYQAALDINLQSRQRK